MKIIKAAFLVLPLAILVVGCDKQGEQAKPGADPAVKAGETAKQAPVTIGDSDLVTPADYEAEAEKDISAKNYKDEIASIEADLAKD